MEIQKNSQKKNWSKPSIKGQLSIKETYGMTAAGADLMGQRNMLS